MTSRSVHLHRVLKTSPDKVYRAFLEGGALAKWLPPYGFTCTVHHLDAKVGGTFEDPNLPGVLEVTVSLTPVICGTALNVTQSGIPDMIPLEMCYLGWQESLEQLAKLVEPDIPA